MKNRSISSMERRLAALLAVLLLSAGYAGSGEEGAAAKKTAGTDIALSGPDAPLRDPFWPVGYQPKTAAAQLSKEPARVAAGAGEIDWNAAMEKISIQGVSTRAGNDFYAVINGEVKSEGETVSVEIGTISYTWMIDDIAPPSSVKLRRLTVGQVALVEDNTKGR
jgi:hypothetical protein